MNDMSPEAQHAAPEKRRRWWRRRHQAGTISIPVLLVLLGLGIAAAAFFMLFVTVYGLLYPVMGWLAVIVPIAGEIAFAYLFLTGVYLAIRKLPSGILRPVMMGALMAGSVVLQVWAARHSVPDATGHLVVVAGFFGIMLVGKSTILTVLGGKVKADRIGLGQWLAHPAHSARLWRWQQSWGEPSRKAADARYRVLLYAVTVAQADERIGREMGWRKKLPPTLRYELSMGALDCEIYTGRPGWQEAVSEHVSGHLDLLPAVQPEGTPEGTAPVIAEAPAAAPPSQPPGQPEVTGQGSRKGTREGSDWPETKDINKAVLMRRVRAACERYEKANDGRRLPALQLSSQLKVRMGRDMATALLRQVYDAPDARSKATR